MIVLQSVTRQFSLGGETVPALDAVNFTLNEGEYVSVMGPSGSGKSTLLNIIGLLDKPDSGRYRFKEWETTELDEESRAALRRQHIGFVFQSYHLVPRLTARENIELPLMLSGVAPAARRATVTNMLQRLGLDDRADHLPAQMSGGQRQRVAIGRAVITKPALILADEPTGNLDSRSGRDVMVLLEELNASGITLLMVTHDAVLGARAPRQVVFGDGCVVSDTGGTVSRG